MRPFSAAFPACSLVLILALIVSGCSDDKKTTNSTTSKQVLSNMKCPIIDGTYVSKPGSERINEISILSIIEKGFVIYSFNDGEDWFSADGQAHAEQNAETGEAISLTITCPNEKTMHLALTKNGVASGEETFSIINDAGDLHVEANLPDYKESADYQKK